MGFLTTACSSTSALPTNIDGVWDVVGTTTKSNYADIPVGQTGNRIMIISTDLDGKTSLTINNSQVPDSDFQRQGNRITIKTSANSSVAAVTGTTIMNFNSTTMSGSQVLKAYDIRQDLSYDIEGTLKGNKR